MDKKLANQNVKSSIHLESDLYKKHYSHAIKDSHKIESNLKRIRKEITSGKARRER